MYAYIVIKVGRVGGRATKIKGSEVQPHVCICVLAHTHMHQKRHHFERALLCSSESASHHHKSILKEQMMQRLQVEG